MKPRVLLLALLCAVGGQASAGLFSDDEARSQVHQVEAQTSKLEEAGRQQFENNKQQAEINVQQAEINKQQAEINKQQTHSMLDLNTQIEMLNAELRRMRGQNEELAHNLRDAEKRQKDFYIDLDTRLRHFETKEKEAAALAVVPAPPPAVAAQPDKAAEGKPANADDPAAENRAYEAAYGLLKAGKQQEAVKAFQAFLKEYPESVHVPNVHYGMGNAYQALKDCKNALASYQVLVGKYAFSARVPGAMLSMADCQLELKAVATARKTLTQIVTRYPGSDAAMQAKKRLATLK
jgi:tol-pal system protein YbgF